jgi:malic enzyme
VEALTAITNAINDSPILKGAMAGAIVLVTGRLAAMAVQAAAAFAAQMGLNFAIGALVPSILAATIVAAGLAAAYTVHAANSQKAAKEAQNLALEQQKQKDAMNDSTRAIENYSRALKDMPGTALEQQALVLRRTSTRLKKALAKQRRRINWPRYTPGKAWRANGPHAPHGREKTLPRCGRNWTRR